MQHVWHNIYTEGRKGGIQRRGMEATKHRNALCFRGSTGCLLLEIRRCDRNKGGSLLAFCTEYLKIAVSEDILVKGVYIDEEEL